MLFPKPKICKSRIENFPNMDSVVLAEIWDLLGQNRIDVHSIQEKILKTLRRWQAYRNQIGTKNEKFVEQIFANQEILDSLFRLISISRIDYSLNNILNTHESDIEKIFNWLVHNLFLDDIPARIVTVSKTLLMLSGFSIGIDTVVRRLIHIENNFLLTCSGVWPSCLYIDTLKFIAQEQIAWEQNYNQPMNVLLPNVPIGQIMDRILWSRE